MTAILNSVVTVYLIQIVVCQDVLLNSDTAGEFIEMLTLENMQERIASLERTVSDLTREIQGLRPTETIPGLVEKRGEGFLFGYRSLQAQSHDVGFHVTMRRDVNMLIDNHIPFDKVITDIGNNYKSGSGKFVCSIPGTYMFSVSIACISDSYIEVVIEKNSKIVFKALSDKTQGSANQGGGTVILKLVQGDNVGVVMKWPWAEVRLRKDFTSFSGYLLKPEY